MPQYNARLNLEGVPQILGQLTRVNGTRKLEKKEGKFAGEIAVGEGMASPDQLGARLLAQSVNKSSAAEMDLETIAKHGSQEHAGWLAANWGNIGVNKATNQPSVTVAGTAAVANIAQNIVMLANGHNVTLAGNHEIQAAVKAGSRLARFISGSIEIAADQAERLKDTLILGLRIAARGAELHDSQHPPQRISLDDFIKERQTEINRGIDEALRLLQARH